MDAAKGTWLVIETIVFLTSLRTQFILEGDAINASQSSIDGRKCSSRKCCADEGFLPLHVIWIGSCFPPSTGFRSQNVSTASGYDVMRRVAFLMLRYRPYGCFYWAAAGATLILSRWWPCLTVKLLLATSLRLNAWQNPARRIKEMLAILPACRMDLWWHGHAIPAQAFPAV